MSALLHAKPDSRRNKRKSSPEETMVVKAVAASVVGAWHLKKSWSSTAAWQSPVERFFVPLDQDFPGRESEKKKYLKPFNYVQRNEL